MSSLRMLIRSGLNCVRCNRSGLQLRSGCATYSSITQQCLLSRTTQHHTSIQSIARSMSTVPVNMKMSTREACDILNIDPSLESSEGPVYIIVGGLPYSAKKKDILEFLEGIDVEGGEAGIIGNYDGLAWVRLTSRKDLPKALPRRDQFKNVSIVSKFELPARYKAAELALGLDYTDASEDILVELSKLTFRTEAEEVRESLDGIGVNYERSPVLDGIMNGVSGKAIVKLKSEEELDKLLRARLIIGVATAKVNKVYYKAAVRSKLEHDSGHFRVALEGVGSNVKNVELCKFLGNVELLCGLSSIKRFSRFLTIVDLATEEDFHVALSSNGRYLGDMPIWVRPAPFLRNIKPRQKNTDIF